MLAINRAEGRPGTLKAGTRRLEAMLAGSQARLGLVNR